MLYSCAYDGDPRSLGGYYGARVRYALRPPHDGPEDSVPGHYQNQPVLVRYACERAFRVSCTGEIRNREGYHVGATNYPVFLDGRAEVRRAFGPPNSNHAHWELLEPPVTTTREAARWLRAYRDQRKEAGC